MIAEAEKRHLLLYYFYPDGVQFHRKRILGHRYQNGQWIKRYFPWPLIVYNRIVSRSLEQGEAVQTLIQRFSLDTDLQFFNSRFLDKWEVYEVLSREPELEAHLPATALMHSAVLYEFLDNYEEIFLKPRAGSTGKGIIKIVKTPAGKYQYALARESSGRFKQALNMQQLLHKLAALKLISSRYIVQQGIRMSRYQGQIFDLRTLMQKNGQGKWVFTGMGARAAARGKFVTHIPNGGKAVPLHELEKELFSSIEQRDEMWKDVAKLALCCAAVLEKQTGLNLGVLSMDMGLDVNGHLWVIEINSKPGVFDEKEIRQRHVSLLHDYFEYLIENRTAGKEG
ncbi:MAG TPA: YheC/YheD family protein [Syntrophomonadaceae bacterium]|nr:YheC/YheD family protein [Syntrophomonadaceae bacterium]